MVTRVRYAVTMTSSLIQTAARAVAAHSMLPPGSPVVVMVSGGADSTALLVALASGEVAADLRLSVLHVNHLLRGADADADEAFVRALAADLDVPCRVVRFDVADWAASEDLNLEDAGRRVRYRFAEEELDERCAEAGVPRADGRIATAHTRDDRVETFLMRLATGAGPSGLTAVHAVRGRVVRPLIDVPRAQVEGFLGDLGRTWREDATNDDTTRLRARIRHDLVPVLLDVVPGAAESLPRSLALLADDDALLAEMADAFVRDFTEPADGGGVAFGRAFMGTLSRPMARRVVRAALVAEFPQAGRLEASHVEALVDGISDPSFARDLPGGLRARAEYELLVVRPAGDEPVLAPALLTLPGEARLGQGGSIVAECAAPDSLTDDPAIALIDADAVGDTLVVDSARPGDRIRPLGMEGTRKVADVLVDAKVPRRQRPVTPVVRDGARIVWVAGVRLAEEVKVTAATRRAFRLTWRREE
jgi:tRNA(Ile)-lysidine synthase